MLRSSSRLRLQFDDRRDLLAIVCRPLQRADHRRVTARAVESQLDGQDTLIVGRRLDELHHVTERFIRMVKKRVPGANGRPQGARLDQLRNLLRHKRLIAQMGQARQTVDLEQAGQIEQVRHTVDVQRVQVEGGRQVRLKGRRGAGLDLQARCRSPAAFTHFLLNGLEQILHFIVVDLVVAVAGHAENGGVQQLHAGKQLRQVQADHGFQRDENVPLLGRQLHQAGQHRGHLHHGEERFLILPALQQHGQVERFVEQMREGMDRINGQGRQHRKDLAPEQVAEVVPIRLGQVLLAAQEHIVSFQRRQDFLDQTAVLLNDEFATVRTDVLQLQPRRRAVGSRTEGNTGLDFLLESADCAP